MQEDITSSVNSNVGDDGGGPDSADCDADRFGPNTEFHVLGMLGANVPLNSINMLKPGQMILFKYITDPDMFKLKH
jgi:hypothetical protein